MYFALAKKCKLKEKLYSALRSKAKINDLKHSEKNIIAMQIKDQGARKNLVDEPRSYSKVRLCEEADGKRIENHRKA
ncbi:2699_t:CDS:2, partial [Gigaspora margarita]